jgi:hypothetical protein
MHKYKDMTPLAITWILEDNCITSDISMLNEMANAFKIAVQFSKHDTAFMLDLLSRIVLSKKLKILSWNIREKLTGNTMLNIPGPSFDISYVKTLVLGSIMNEDIEMYDYISKKFLIGNDIRQQVILMCSTLDSPMLDNILTSSVGNENEVTAIDPFIFDGMVLSKQTLSILSRHMDIQHEVFARTALSKKNWKMIHALRSLNVHIPLSSCLVILFTHLYCILGVKDLFLDCIEYALFLIAIHLPLVNMLGYNTNPGLFFVAILLVHYSKRCKCTCRTSGVN